MFNFVNRAQQDREAPRDKAKDRSAYQDQRARTAAREHQVHRAEMELAHRNR